MFYGWERYDNSDWLEWTRGSVVQGLTNGGAYDCGTVIGFSDTGNVLIARPYVFVSEVTGTPFTGMEWMVMSVQSLTKNYVRASDSPYVT